MGDSMLFAHSSASSSAPIGLNYQLVSSAAPSFALNSNDWIKSNFPSKDSYVLELNLESSNQQSTVQSSAIEFSGIDFDLVQEMLSHLLNGYLTLFSVFSGILLNCLCIYVFVTFQRTGSPVIQYYLVTLTCWQTALLANAFLLYCLPTLLFGHVVSSGPYVLLYPYAYAFANTTHTGSHRAIGKKSRVKRLMIAVSILAILFSAPRFFEVTTVYYCSGEGNATICEATVARTALPEDETYWTIYHIVLAMLFVTLAPCLLLFALTLRISLALRQSIVKRRALCAPSSELDGRNKKQNCSKKEHKANIMLVLVIAKFLISDILPTVADVLEHLVGNQVFMSSSLATLFVDFSNFLVVLNCSTNFWVFLFWGKRFRRCCVYLLADSALGHTLNKWIKIAVDSEFTSYYGQPRSSLTIKSDIRSRCSGDYGGGGNNAYKSSLMGPDSAATAAAMFLISAANRKASENSRMNITEERLLAINARTRPYYPQPGRKCSSVAQTGGVPRVQRAKSYAGVDVGSSASPTEAPTDYHLNRSSKNRLVGKVFVTLEELVTDVKAWIVEKNGERDFWARGIDRHPTKWEAVIEVDGEYAPE
uniref:G-protein coupled receptors family 1 profile domain-containing protein n=1 Tax=Ditylenchus dipsaci TaxID=166011 RepID=A0A915CZ38_9BILA